jgi:hypothetical protein
MVLVSGVIALGAAAPRSSGASPSGAQAEVLFREGKSLMAEGKIAEACTAFDNSQKLEPAISTLLNAGNCREKNHQIATAWGLFLEAERQTRDAADEPTRKLHKVSAEHAQRLESRVSKLTINVSPDARAQHAEILRGPETIGEGLWNLALPIDGGTYVISARAPERAPWSLTVVVKEEGDAQTVDVPGLASATPSPGPEASVAPSATGAGTLSTAHAPPPATSAGGSPAAVVETARPARSIGLPLAFAAGSVVALGTALAFDLSGDSTYDRAKTEPDPSRQQDLWHEANTKRYIAEGLLVAGVGCAGVAAWLFFRAPPAAPAAQRVVLLPAIEPGGAGFSLAGAF